MPLKERVELSDWDAGNNLGDLGRGCLKEAEEARRRGGVELGG